MIVRRCSTAHSKHCTWMHTTNYCSWMLGDTQMLVLVDAFHFYFLTFITTIEYVVLPPLPRARGVCR